MAYLAVDKDGLEIKTSVMPERELCNRWSVEWDESLENLPKGSIEKLIGKKLTWQDEPIELKE